MRAVPNHQSAPALSPNGADFLVVWQEAPTTQTNEADIAGVAINANGLILTNTLAVLNSNPGGQMAPVMAGDSNGRFLVVNQGFAFATARTVANWADFGWSNNAPARLHSVRLLSNGQFQFTVSGEPGLRFRLEASTNLTDWVPLEVLPGTNGTLQYADPASINLDRRFYRVSTIP